MKKTQDLDEAPLYVRWTPETVPVTLELRLDVAALIQKEVEQANDLDIEIGGVLVGQAIAGDPTVLRIDDVVMISRKPEDGQIFLLDPSEHDRFLTTRWDSRAQGRAAVGLFRTHLRSGPMRLSLADRTLITGHFTKEAVMVLLIQGKVPRRAALFVGAGSKLPDEPSVPEFLFDEREFRALPEAEEEDRPEGRKRSPAWTLLLWAAVAVIILSVAGAVYRGWDDLQTAFGGGSQGPALNAAGTSLIRVTWNHNAADIRKATAAKLTIEDGELHREVSIGPDELRLGTVEYDPQNTSVAVTLILSMPDATTVTQSVIWHGS